MTPIDNHLDDSTNWIINIHSDQATIELVGTKAYRLSKLSKLGFSVPEGFVVSTTAYASAENYNTAQFQSSCKLRQFPPELKAAICQAYQKLGQIGQSDVVVVRSSIVVEDGQTYSFAGQYETILNVRGDDAVLAAIQQCWLSFQSSQAQAYSSQFDLDQRMGKVAVIVQSFIDADVSGVLFTANPISGSGQQMVIEGVRGLARDMIRGIVTGDLWVIDRNTKTIIEEKIQEKTTRLTGGPNGLLSTALAAEPSYLPSLSPKQCDSLIDNGQLLEKHFQTYQDIEWAYSNRKLYILQTRPITTLCQKDDEWSNLNLEDQWARVSLIESVPGPISPFFGTVGLPTLSAGYHRAAAALGVADALPTQLFIDVNGFAYYRVRFPFHTQLRIIHFLLRKGHWLASTILARWQEALTKYRAVVTSYDPLTNQPIIDTQEILNVVKELFSELAQYYVAIQSGILPQAYLTETIFSRIYLLLVKDNRFDLSDFFKGLDIQAIEAETALFDLANTIKLNSEMSDLLFSAPLPIFLETLPNLQNGNELLQGIKEYVCRFGHHTYSIDPVVVPVGDSIVNVISYLSFLLKAEQSDPKIRTEKNQLRREQAVAHLKKHPMQWLLLRQWKRAKYYARLREDALVELGLAIPLIRRLMLRVGQKLVSEGSLASPDDIFFLTEDEISAFAEKKLLNGQTVLDLVKLRKQKWIKRRQAQAPAFLPKELPAPSIRFARMAQRQQGVDKPDRLIGIATSPGQITGTAVVVHHLTDLEQLIPQTILITNAITPAWSAVLGSFIGIVTEIGGPLSHSSIIAREYGIPAVMGVATATSIITSGQTVTVDGTNGVVTIYKPKVIREKIS